MTSVGSLAPHGAAPDLPVPTPRLVVSWRLIVGSIVVIIFFVPITRYTLPGNLPFDFEPYRVVVAAVVAAWIVALLVDPRIRITRSFLDGPLWAVGIAAAASVAVNPARVSAVGSATVLKGLTYLVSFFLVTWLLVSVVRDQRTIDMLVKLVVVSGTIVAAFAVVESRIEYNVFDHLAEWIPLLELSNAPQAQNRGALRAYGSAQVAIALGAVLVMLIPLAIYLVRRTGRRHWLVAVLVLTVGALATISRTAVLMLIAIALVYMLLRPRETRRMWPLLLPALVVIHLAIPGVLGTVTQSFFPKGGLIAEQSANAGTGSAGRAADIGPALEEFGKRPFLGRGYGTDIVNLGARRNADVLDNQWLGTLLQTGLTGVIGWAWLFTRSVRRFGGAARREDGPLGWLFTGLAASTTAFAVGMLTYDAFAFVQSTFVMFIMLGLGAAALALPRVTSIAFPRPRALGEAGAADAAVSARSA